MILTQKLRTLCTLSHCIALSMYMYMKYAVTLLQVVWMDKSDNVLYYNENPIIDDRRFTLSRYNRNWDLTIERVRASDAGTYRCVANIVPIKLKYYRLTVFGESDT